MKSSKKTAIGLLVIVVLVTGIVLVVSALTEEGNMDDSVDDGMDDGMEGDDKMGDGMDDGMDNSMEEDDKMEDGMEGDDKMENDSEESPFPALLVAGGIFGALALARRMSG